MKFAFPFFLVCVPLILCCGSVTAKDHKAEERLIFADDFERTESKKAMDDLGRGWMTNAHEPWSRAPKQAFLQDGAVKVIPADGQESGVLIYRYTHFFDGSAEFRFLLPHADDQIRFVLADNSLKNVHAGHVLSVRLEAGRVVLTDMLSGGFDPDIYARRKRGQSTQEDKERIAACRKSVSANIQVGHWHQARIAIRGDHLSVQIDGQPVGTFQSKGFANRKSELRLSVPRFGSLDDFRHSIADAPESSHPRHLLITRRNEAKFELIKASEEQREQLNQISLNHRRYILGLRDRVGITRELVRRRDEAFREAKEKGLTNRALWQHIQESLNLSDQQSEAFRVTFERHRQFQAETLDLLSAEQRVLFRQAKVEKKSETDGAQSATKPASAQPTSSQPASGRPNVLFIAIDDLNNHVLGLNGKAIAKTPNLEKLAGRGTLFTNAHCAAPACNPSRASVMTGVSPFHSGVYVNSQDWRQCQRLKEVTTLPQHFRDHGYKVMGGGKLYHASNLRPQHLEGYLDPKPWHQYFPSKSRQLADEVTPPGQAFHGSNQFYAGRFDWKKLDIEDNDMGDGKVVSWAEQQLSRSHDQPLFLGVGIYRPHIPWHTPRKWFANYPLASIRLPRDVKSDMDDIPKAGNAMARQHWHQWLVDHEKWDDAVQAYLASVSFADEMVGRLIRALDAGPLAGNTIIVLWSDHGYHLGHKSHWEKFALWRQTTQVPLIVVDHRQKRHGDRCDRPVSLLDLYPTLSELCGLGLPTHLDGESLMPFLANPSATSDRSVVITHQRNNHAVQTQQWRYIRYSDGSHELYDHREDPEERKNLASLPSHADVVRQLATRLPQQNVSEDPAIR